MVEAEAEEGLEATQQDDKLLAGSDHACAAEELGADGGQALQQAAEELRRCTANPATCGVEPKLQQTMWQYRDNKGSSQGPFTSAQMAQWHEHKMLRGDLPLRPIDDNIF